MHKEKKPLSTESYFSFLCKISDQYHTGVIIIDLKGENFPIVYSNDAFTQLTSYKSNELYGKSLSLFNGTKTDLEVANELDYNLLHKIPFELNLLHYKKDGTPFWNNISCQPLQVENSDLQYALLYCKDITERMLSKMLLKLEHEVYAELEKESELTEVLNLITEKVEKYYIRDIYCAIHIIQQNGMLSLRSSGSLPLAFIHHLHNIEVSTSTGYNQTAIYIKQLSFDHIETAKAAKDYKLSSCWSKPIFNKDKALVGYFTIYTKNNLELKQADIEFLKKLSPIIALSIKFVEQKEQLKQLAFYDLNTGIPNYNYFYTNLQQWAKEDVEGSILLIQPSEYSSIVDLYGRKIGDELIRQLVHRIESTAIERNEVIYGRFSNSSFIVCVKNHAQKVEEFISHLMQVTKIPFAMAEREMFITLKIGISCFDRTIPVDESIRRADIALTKSLSQNGATLSVFEQETDEKMQRELEILNQLTYGLQNEEFSVHLQPKVNLTTAEIEGFEALARWYSPVLGHVSPAEFIPIAEQAGKISDVDCIILKEVLKFQNERKQKNLKMLPIAVNISPVHFYRENFVEDFISLVNQYQVSPSYIKIEVTESMELFDYNTAKEILLELKKCGYDSSIDDFGVGFSSLSYLQQLPFSEIKIDRSFINNIHDTGMHAVVQTIVQLASNLNMHAVAEGIETLEQYVLLQKMGCKAGQGYYFHKPMPLDEAEKLLNTIK